MSTRRLHALVVGLAYLVTHVTAIAAVVAYGPILTDPSARVIPARMHLGITLELILALACVVTAVGLLPVLRQYQESLAFAFMGLRVVEAAVILAGSMAMFALVWPVPQTSVQALSTLVSLHQGSFLIGQGLVIAVNTLVIAWLIWSTRIVFRWIGVLGLIGGVTVLASDLAQLYGVIDFGGTTAMILAVPVFAFEIWFSWYLMVLGFGREARAEPQLATS